jgi:hypothetical protein
MTIQSPHLPEPLLATRESIEATIRLISSKEGDLFAIVSGSDDRTFMQTLFTPEGFSLEYQDGSLEAHHETVRSDLSAEEVVEAFCDYADGNTTWRARFDFRRREIRSLYYRIGHVVGSFAGRVARLFANR